MNAAIIILFSILIIQLGVSLKRIASRETKDLRRQRKDLEKEILVKDVRMDELKTESNEIEARLSGYRERLNKITRDSERFRILMTESMNGLEDAIEAGDLETARDCRNRGLIAIEQLDAFVAEGEDIKDKWEEDEARVDEILKEFRISHESEWK